MFPSSTANSLRAGFARPLVKGLFAASCLLSAVSFYTTQQGMALYLSSWFSVTAALGIQLALVLVAWLIGFTRRDRVTLTLVYIATALVSVGFSYVSLYTWFNARERPALMRRNLYDELTATAGRAGSLLGEAAVRGRGHVLALEEMTRAEKTHGRISRAKDADPFLNRIREAVSKEAQTYQDSYREGAGEGVRYTAFERHTAIVRGKTEEVESARQALDRIKGELRPAMESEQQLRVFRQVYDTLPWSAAAELLNREKIEPPAAPAYANFVESSGSGQEDLMRAFSELISGPTPRHLFSLVLAAFIDLIVFLLAWSSGPYFHGDPEQRWLAASATLDAIDDQVFARELLRKFRPGFQGMPRVDAAELTPGEQQFCLLLVSKGQAVAREDGGRTHYLFDAATHERMIDALGNPGMPLRAAAPGA